MNAAYITVHVELLAAAMFVLNVMSRKGISVWTRAELIYETIVKGVKEDTEGKRLKVKTYVRLLS